MTTLTSNQIKSVRKVNPEQLIGDRVQVGHPLFGAIWINPERMHGAACFYGTRVPVRNLFDSLEAGETLDEFLEGFEGVSREQAKIVLEMAGQGLLASIESA